MSASEKLKALERRIEEHGSPDNDLHGEDLLLALPQIVAVVEVAEGAWPPPHDIGMTSSELFNRAHAALAALEEALQ